MCLLQIQRGGFFKLSLERGRERERKKEEREGGADLNHDIASFRLHTHFLLFYYPESVILLNNTAWTWKSDYTDDFPVLLRTNILEAHIIHTPSVPG